MSAITLEQARAQLSALLDAQSAGNFRSVSVGGRTVTYATTAEMLEAITFWERKVNQLTRVAAGGSPHNVAHADFRTRR